MPLRVAVMDFRSASVPGVGVILTRSSGQEKIESSPLYGVTDRLWEVSDPVALLEAEERRLERAA
jgi:hypothetical protein